MDLLFSLFRKISAFLRRPANASPSGPSLAAEQLEPRILYSAAPVEVPPAEAAQEAPAPAAAAPAPAQETAPAAQAPVAVEAPAEVAATNGDGEIADDAAVELVDVDDNAASLNQEVVETLAAEARQRWIDSGISEQQIEALESVSYQVADVGGAHLGVANGFTITIDDDAGGTGADNWFIDATPEEDSEFGSGISAASGRYDLLSTLIHEQGHVLGLGDLSGQRENVMDGLLYAGTRRLPVEGQAEGAVIGSLVGENFLMANIVRVSTDSNGVEGNGSSSNRDLSADGRYVVFSSDASNLVADDTNGETDIFLRDMHTGVVKRISTDTNGVQADGRSLDAAISADGRFVAFRSQATNLVPNDNNGRTDIFLKDLESGEVTRVSTDTNGGEANSSSYGPSISADGRFVAFYSGADNLGVTNPDNYDQVYVKDVQTGQLIHVSYTPVGGVGDDGSYSPAISADGRYVAFSSDTDDLDSDDDNSSTDIYVRDLKNGKLVFASTDARGKQSTNGAGQVDISANGRFVVFTGYGGEFVEGDTNGLNDVFRKDLRTGKIVRVSTTASGEQSVSDRSNSGSISADGRYVSFTSEASDLIPGDTNGESDIFVKDLETGQIVRVSTDATGGEANDLSFSSRISDDGRFVSFGSVASNLVGGDTNGVTDVFARGIEPAFRSYTTSVEVDSNGNLVIEDIDGENTDDNLFIGIVDGRLEISDKKATVGSTIFGSTLIGSKGRGVSVDLSAFTGDIVVNTLGGKDRVTFGDLHDLPGGVHSIDDSFDEQVDMRGEIALTGASSFNVVADRIALHRGSSITTDSGTIEMFAESDFTRGRTPGFQANGATISSNTGWITIDADGAQTGGGNRAVFLKNTDIVTADGIVQIEGGVQAPGSGNTGLHFARGTDIMISGTGYLSLRGTVEMAKNGNRGIRIDSGATLQTTDGNLTIRGVVDNSLSSNTGVQIGKATVTAASSGGFLGVSGSVSGNTGSRNVAVNLKGSTIESLGNSDVRVDYMGNISTDGRGNLGVVMSSARIFANDADVKIIKDPNIIGGENFGNTGVRAVKTDIISQTGDIEIQGFHDENRIGNGNRGFSFTRGTINAGGMVDIEARGGGGGSSNVAMQISSATIMGNSLTMAADAASTTTGGNNRGIDFNKVDMLIDNFVSIAGNAGAGASNNEGVRIRGGSIVSTNSAVFITGNANPLTDTTKANNTGLNFSNTSIQANQILNLTGQSGTGTNGNSAIKMRNVEATSQTSTATIRGYAQQTTTAAATGKGNRGIEARNLTVSAAGKLAIEARGGYGTNNNEAITINVGSLTSTGNDIEFLATPKFTTTGAGNGGLIMKNVDAMANGAITINATGGGGTNKNSAVSIGGGSLTAQTGDVTINGTAEGSTSGSSNHGVELLGLMISAPSNDVIIDGTGGGGVNQNMGVRIIGSSILPMNGSGGVDVTGVSRFFTSGSWNVGVYVFNKVTIGGDLQVDGTGGGGTKLNHGIFMNKNITANATVVNGTAGAGDGSGDEAGDFFAP